jgi:hypothetical protein
VRSNGPFRLSLCIVLIAGLVFPFSVRPSHAANGYTLLDAATEQRLPDRQGILGNEASPQQAAGYHKEGHCL